MPQRRTIAIDGESLTPEAVGQVASREARVRLAPAAAVRMRAARAIVERAVARGETTYGVNTGFGKLATVKVPAADLAALQLNLIRSHAAGVGPLAAPETVRALLLLRANVLARGTSGVRPVLARHLLAMLEHDLLPAVPEQGSVGASGDLAPLAHVALAAIGEGEMIGLRGVIPARRALAAAGLQPPTLAAKEGLALVNGTQFGAAIATLALLRAECLARSADVAAALSIDVLLGSRSAFDRRIQAARPHPGQSVSRRISSRCWPEAGSWPRTPTAVASRMPIRCAALPRSRARRATRWRSCGAFSRSRSTARPTTRWFSHATARSSRAATSTPRPSPRRSTMRASQ